MIIRKATKKDRLVLEKMFMELARYEHRLNKLKTADKKTQDFLSKNLPRWLTQKNYFIFIAEEGKKPIGYIFGWKEYISEAYRNPHVGYICDCYVNPEHRGNCVGKKLVARLLSEFKKLGLKEAKLTVLSCNPACKIWERLGFKEEYKEMRKLF
jgi:ribosomal protein S18 acetylase RimI-like enzyme